MEKKPFLTESMAQDIIQDVPTPFHVYDEKGIRENARRINKAFSWNKGFREYSAVKALPNPVILQILKDVPSVNCNEGEGAHDQQAGHGHTHRRKGHEPMGRDTPDALFDIIPHLSITHCRNTLLLRH